MAVRFPDEPSFQGRFAPVRLEGEIRGVEVTQGEIPASLRGTYYRVGADPAPAWPPFVERDFYFNADGMVAMFRFENGYCDFKSRYVRTPRFVAEREARRSLFGAYRNPFTDDPSVALFSRGLANTNVYWHGRQLCSPPRRTARRLRIDPDTLDTVGNDVGTQYRSAIYTFSDAQRKAADASKAAYQKALAAKGLGTVTTEIAPAGEFYFAEDYHQQYLAKNPAGYCGLGGTGVSCPIGAGVSA